MLAARGQLSAISAEWLGKDVITLDGSADALDGLLPEDTGRTLIIGVEADFPPMASEKNGEYVGMSVDIGRAVAALMNCPVTIQPISVSQVGAQLASGNIDCAIGFDTGLLSAEKYDIGFSYMDSDIILAVREGSEVRRLKDLKAQRIGITDDPAVQKAVKASEKLTKYASGATVYLSAQRCFHALDNGWCAAAAMDRLRFLWTPQT